MTEDGASGARSPESGGGWTAVDSGGPTAPARQPRRLAVLRALAVATAALLGVDAYVHLRDAGLYDAIATATLSQGTLFRAQAVTAGLVAITLLLRPHPVMRAMAVLVAASAAAAVLLYTYVDVGSLGPLPNMYEPTWALPGKRASALAETAATVLALTGLALAVATRPRAVRQATAVTTKTPMTPTGRGRVGVQGHVPQVDIRRDPRSGAQAAARRPSRGRRRIRWTQPQPWNDTRRRQVPRLRSRPPNLTPRLNGAQRGGRVGPTRRPPRTNSRISWPSGTSA
jgi:hypothetical protein